MCSILIIPNAHSFTLSLIIPLNNEIWARNSGGSGGERHLVRLIILVQKGSLINMMVGAVVESNAVSWGYKTNQSARFVLNSSLRICAAIVGGS